VRSFNKKLEEEHMTLSFECFESYDEAIKIYRLIIIQYNNPFLSIISTGMNSEYVKFVSYDPKVSHRRHVL
jgi:hypothetical protein